MAELIGLCPDRDGLLICIASHMIIALALSAAGQDVAPLKLTNAGAVSGVLHMQADLWTAMRGQVSNPADVAQTATYSLHLDRMPNVQFRTEVWVPPRARRVIEVPIRAPDASMVTAEPENNLSAMAFSGEGLLLVPGAAGETRLDSGNFLVMRRVDRPVTAMIAGTETHDLSRRIVAAVRDVSRLSPRTHFLRESSLPNRVEGWQGVDALILCTPNPRIDGVQVEAIRQWVASGGRLWIMLDTVSVSFAATLLEDAWNCSVVDTATLTEICIRPHDGEDSSVWPAVDRWVTVDRYRDRDGLFGAARMALGEALGVADEKVTPQTRLVADLELSGERWRALAARLAVHFHVTIEPGDLEAGMEGIDDARVADLLRYLRARVDAVDVGGHAVVAPDDLGDVASGRRVMLRHPDALTHKNQLEVQKVLERAKPDELYLERVYEQALRMVRLVAPGWETLYTVKGWPAAIRRRYGDGWVLATTLEAQGWVRSREEHDPKPSGMLRVDPSAGGTDDAGGAKASDAPSAAPKGGTVARSSYVARRGLKPLSTWFNRSRVRELVPQDAYSKMAVQQVGYTIIGRSVIVLIMGLFVIGIAAAGFCFRVKGRLEYVAVVGVFLAVVLSAVLVAIGAVHRHAIPLTLAKVEVVQISNAPDYAIVSGVLGTYAPEGGMGPLSARQGGLVWPDRKGQESEDLRLIWSDLDQWTWDNLRLPSGAMRDNAFHYVTPLAEPTEAMLSFDDDGARITLSTGTFTGFTDGLIATATGRTAIRQVGEDDWVAAESDRLHDMEFIRGSSGLTSDLQQRRGQFYGRIIPNLFRQSRRRAAHERVAGQPEPKLLGFSSAIDTGFSLPEDQQWEDQDETLLVISLQVSRPAVGTAVSVPSVFVGMAPMRGGNQLYNPMVMAMSARPEAHGTRASRWMAPPQGGRSRLRFAVPENLVPWRVDKAELVIKIRAADRTLSVCAIDGEQCEPIHESESPSSTVTVPLPASSRIELGQTGSTALQIKVGAVSGGGVVMQGWQIDDVFMRIDGEIVEVP